MNLRSRDRILFHRKLGALRKTLKRIAKENTKKEKCFLFKGKFRFFSLKASFVSSFDVKLMHLKKERRRKKSNSCKKKKKFPEERNENGRKKGLREGKKVEMIFIFFNYDVREDFQN